MPVYVYRCGGCGRRLERRQKMSARPLRRCPHCKRYQLKRIITAGHFALRGLGWGRDR